MGVSIKDIAAPSSGDSWDPQVGDTVVGDITFVKMMAPKLNFNKDKLEQEIRIDLLEDNGHTTTIWAVTNTDTEGDGYPSRLARAIATGVRNGGADELEVGGRLAVGRIQDVPPSQPGRHPAKEYVAEYRPPSNGVSLNLLGGPQDSPTQPPVQVAGAPMMPPPGTLQSQPAFITPQPAAVPNPFAGLMGEPMPAQPTGLVHPQIQPQHMERASAIFGLTPSALAGVTPAGMAQLVKDKGVSAEDAFTVLAGLYGPGLDGVLTEAISSTYHPPAPPPAPAANPLAGLLGGGA
jgi:hypothetical protein